MTHEKDARHPGEPENLRDGGREELGSVEAAVGNDTAAGEAEDEEAIRKAREWRVGKTDAWEWMASRLAAQLEAGRSYASMRQLTDELGQLRDFVDDRGRKVSVPHNKGLGRGIALLMIQECPEFAKLFRMRSKGEA